MLMYMYTTCSITNLIFTFIELIYFVLAIISLLTLLELYANVECFVSKCNLTTTEQIVKFK